MDLSTPPIEAYADVLFHNVSVQTAMSKLGTSERYGVTDGQIYNIRGSQDRKKEFVSLENLGNNGDPGLRVWIWIVRSIHFLQAVESW